MFFGRGAKQLSYNYNYGPFSQAMFGDVRVLLDNPDMVADTWLNLASAVFFFVYPQPPKPSMLHVIDGTWQPNAADKANNLTPGFGVTTQIINGGVECGGSVEVAQSMNRIDYYGNFMLDCILKVLNS
ncbi:chitinase [Francisella noatunensis]